MDARGARARGTGARLASGVGSGGAARDYRRGNQLSSRRGVRMTAQFLLVWAAVLITILIVVTCCVVVVPSIEGSQHAADKRYKQP